MMADKHIAQRNFSMLNRLKFEGSKEAKIRYLESDFEVMVPGDRKSVV